MKSVRWLAVPFDPFDPESRLEHFLRHGHEFGADSAEEYEAMADKFWHRPVIPPLHECTRGNGAKCRYDRETDEYSVMTTRGLVTTYFVPVPCARFEEDDDECPDDCHGFASNMEYFRARCN